MADEQQKPPFVPASRADLALLRQMIAAGTYPLLPRECEMVKAVVLDMMKPNWTERTRIMAARTHVALMTHNLKTMEMLMRMEEFDGIGVGQQTDEGDVIVLPAGGPWGGPHSVTDQPATPPPADDPEPAPIEEADDAGDDTTV